MFNALTRIFTKTDPMWERFRQEADKKAMFTPDLAELKDFEKMRVFVYNELQKDQPKNSLLSSSEYCGACYTQNSDFVLYKKLLGKETFPIAMEVTKDNRFGISSLIGDPGQVMGETYSVTPETIVELDNYLLNTVEFDRKRIKIVIPYFTEADSACRYIETEAWMWVGRSEFWNDQLFIKDQDGPKFARSERLFVDIKDETLGGHYIFDYKLEATEK